MPSQKLLLDKQAGIRFIKHLRGLFIHCSKRKFTISFCPLHSAIGGSQM